MSHKRELTLEEKKKAEFLFMRRMSVKALAKHFKVTKPVILKSLGLWETEVKTVPDKVEYKVVRGKMVIVRDFVQEKKDKENFMKAIASLTADLNKLNPPPKTNKYFVVNDLEYYMTKREELKIVINPTLFAKYIQVYGQEFVDKHFWEDKRVVV